MAVTLFLLIASKSDDLSCRLLTAPIFPRRISSVISKFSHKKINFTSGVTPGGCHPGRFAPPPSSETPLSKYTDVTTCGAYYV